MHGSCWSRCAIADGNSGSGPSSPSNVIPCVFFPTLAPSRMVHAPDLPPTPAPGSTPRLPESRHWGSALRANPPIFVPSADATMQAPASHRAIAQHRLRTGTTHDCPWNQTPPSPPNVRALRPTVSTTDPFFLQVRTTLFSTSSNDLLFLLQARTTSSPTPSAPTPTAVSSHVPLDSPFSVRSSFSRLNTAVDIMHYIPLYYHHYHLPSLAYNTKG
jgi:hypothetical protein